VSSAQEWVHKRRIPHRPDQKSIKEQVTERYDRRQETLEKVLQQRQAHVDDHESGRKLLSDEDLNRHSHHIKGLKRKLASARHVDEDMRKLEIEQQTEMHQKMLEGEFIFTSDGLVLKDP